MAKRGSKAKKVVREDLSGVDFTFADGRVLAVNLSDIPNAAQIHATLHGISQKVGDSYAGAEDVNEAHEAAQGVVEALKKGDWKVRVAGEGGSGGVTLLVQALYEVTKSDGRTMDDCNDIIAEMDDDQKKALREMAPIKAAIEKIKLDRQQARLEKAQKDAANSPLDLSAFGVS